MLMSTLIFKAIYVITHFIGLISQPLLLVNTVLFYSLAYYYVNFITPP